MVPRPKGEESEALNRVAFASLGQKRRAFQTPSMSILQTYSIKILWDDELAFVVFSDFLLNLG